MKFSRLIEKLNQILLTPNSYAKKVGVRFGKNCKFLTRNFGSEPYLITIGDNYEFSFNVSFITHDGGLWVIRNLYQEYKKIDLIKPIKIGDNVFIGANTTILPGSKINDNVIVGANSLVNKELESNSVYAGIPVRKISTLDEYILKNHKLFMQTKSFTKEEKKEYLLKVFNNE